MESRRRSGADDARQGESSFTANELVLLLPIKMAYLPIRQNRDVIEGGGGRDSELRMRSALLPAAPPAGAASLRRSGNFRPPSRSTPHWILGDIVRGKEKTNKSLRRDPSWKYSVQVDIGGGEKKLRERRLRNKGLKDDEDPLALIDSTSFESSLDEEIGVRMVALFDHEELVDKAIQQSFLVSADMAHAIHPNYMDKHEDNHQPKLHGGLGIKHNANQRYVTNAITSFIFREIAERHDLPIQVSTF
ncbi:putative aspartyl aminopeptidase [Dendrobium catenatum]|uniref:Putative aspartyl aminopeptidase n=1 Tax=Dendrobium catenatum TaxID=906689 RepID=A0A2I0X088_9ASPA|nr:putative aspartyl aminopeptidase [Dendrobium catenatum]